MESWALPTIVRGVSINHFHTVETQLEKGGNKQSKVLVPSAADNIGPMVLPQEESFLTTNNCNGTPELVVESALGFALLATS